MTHFSSMVAGFLIGTMLVMGLNLLQDIRRGQSEIIGATVASQCLTQYHAHLEADRLQGDQ